MKSNKLTRGLYASAAVLMMLSPAVGTMAGTIAGNFGTQVVSAAGAVADDTELNILIHKYGSETDVKYAQYIGEGMSPEDAKAAINKFLQENDVNSVDTNTYRPLENIKFKVVQVKPKENKKPDTIKPDDPNTYDPVTNVNVDGKVFTTDSTGSVKVNVGKYANEKGLYIVEELASSGIDKPVANSLIQLPMSYTDTSGDTQYRTDLNIYPKNKITTPDTKNSIKKVINHTESDLQIGGTAVWDLRYDVPKDAYVAGSGAGDTATYAKSLVITDTLDSRLGIDATGVKGMVDPATAGVNPALVLNTDYTVEVVGQLVTIKMLPAGFEKTHGKTAVFTISAKINSIGAIGSQEIPNKFTAEYTPSTGGTPDTGTTTPQKPTDPTDPNSPGETVLFGRIDLEKTSSENGKPLAGAEFTVYYDDKAENAVKTVNKEQQGSENAAGGDLKFVTDADGKGHVYGLKAGVTYYIQETKTPEGFKENKTVYPVKSPGAKNGIDDKDAIDIKVQNDVDAIYNFIPMTGSQRRIALMAMGATLAVGSMIYVYATKRKKDEDEA